MRFLTINVYFGEEYWRERAVGLAKLVARETPPVDVVAMQEVTPHALLVLRTQLQAVYEFSPVPPGSPYFTVILARKALAQSYAMKFERRPFRTSVMGRDLLLLDLIPRSGATLSSSSSSSSSTPATMTCTTLACVHLESENQAAERANQTRTIAEMLQSRRNNSRVILGGDFNFDDLCNYPMRRVPKDQLENANLERYLPDFVDLWPHLKGDDRGLTFDHAFSKKWTGKTFGSLKARYDRVLGRGANGEPVRAFVRGIQIFADVPIGKTEKGDDLYASDHFGVLVDFEAGAASKPVMDTNNNNNNNNNKRRHELVDEERTTNGEKKRKQDVIELLSDDDDSVEVRIATTTKSSTTPITSKQDEQKPSLDPKEELRRRRLAWIDKLPDSGAENQEKKN